MVRYGADARRSGNWREAVVLASRHHLGPAQHTAGSVNSKLRPAGNSAEDTGYSLASSILEATLGWG